MISLRVAFSEHAQRTCIFHLSNGDISQNSGIVDLRFVSNRTAVTAVSIYQDIDTPKVLDSCVDDLVAILDGVIVCNCDAPSFLDFFDNLVGNFGALRVACTIECSSKIVDDEIEVCQRVCLICSIASEPWHL